MQENETMTPEEEQETVAGTQEIAQQAAQQTETGNQAAKMKELQDQLEEARNKYLYLLSDFENFKRHSARERMDLIQTASRDIVAALLPVLDDFERAAKSDALNEGTALIHNKIVHTLRSKGLNLLETKPGDEFNADLHEAVAEIPAASEELKGRIVDILEPGYLLGERIIRFAKVVVGK